MQNFIAWLDIPVLDLERAKKFYSSVFAVECQDQHAETFTMSILRDLNGQKLGSLVLANDRAPSWQGTRIHLHANAPIADLLERTQQNGGKIIEEPNEMPSGKFALIEDSEGNRIGLYLEKQIN